MLEQKDLQAIAELIDIRFTKIEDRFDVLEGRFDALEERFSVLEGRFDALEERFNVLEGRFDVLEEKVNVLERRFDALEEKVESLEGRISDVEKTLVNELVRTEDKLCRRIDRVEKNLDESKKYFKFERFANGEAALSLRLLAQ